MIEITTLFLSLIFGPQVVEVDVSPDVAAVEIILDGETVAEIEGPPWRARVDLGTELLAHRLEAVAFDRARREIDRTSTWLNLGHQRQGGRMVLLEGESGRPEAVALGWESIGQREPLQLDVYFDGDPLEVDDPEHIPLPAYDAGEFHFVSAVLHFQNGARQRMELGFGGRLGLEVSSDLTALAVRPGPDARPPRLDDVESAFRLRDSDQPLRVHGLEEGDAEVVVVRDHDVQPALADLVRRIANAALPGMWERRSMRLSAQDSGPDIYLQSENLQRYARLPPDTRFRVQSPSAAPLQPTGVSRDMFLVSEPFDGQEQGFLATALQNPPQRRPTQLGSAVALAGMVAHGTQRPRAVILLLGDGEADESAIPPEAARAYLQDLGVPLHVWAFEPLPKNSGWGEIQSLGPRSDLTEVKSRFSKLTWELAADLRRQRLVWLEGRYLPRDIQLAPDARGIEFVGRNPPPNRSTEPSAP